MDGGGVGDEEVRVPLLSAAGGAGGIERQDSAAGAAQSKSGAKGAGGGADEEDDAGTTAPMFDPAEYPYLDENLLNELRDIQVEFDVEAAAAAPEELPHADEDVFKVGGLGIEGGVGVELRVWLGGRWACRGGCG
jgi:hypothetical protein